MNGPPSVAHLISISAASNISLEDQKLNNSSSNKNEQFLGYQQNKISDLLKGSIARKMS